MFKRRSKLKTTPNLQVLNGGKEAPPTPPHTEQPLLEAQRVEGGENLRTKVSERLTTSGISQATLAEQIGISTTAVSQWLGGKYEGDNQAVAIKMQKWVEENPQFAVPPSVKVPVFVKTKTAEHIQAALTYAHVMRDVVVIHGGAGMGKTTTAAHYASRETGCWVITMAPSFASSTACLKNVLFALAHHEQVGGRGGDTVLRMILQHLRGRECLLIIDEAQHLMLPALESLRSIHDATECGLVLMGNEAVYSRLSGRRSAEFAQLYSRVGSVLKLENPLPRDTTALAEQWGGGGGRKTCA